MSQNHRVESIFATELERNAAKIDRFFAGLFLLQWGSRIALAWFHPQHDDDLFTATVIGAFIASMPTMLVVWKPGAAATRHAIAVAQMLYGALLVHLTKGAAATHVHVLFSLAILALYRDPLVVVTGAVLGILQTFALTDLPVAEVWTMWTACVGAVAFYAARRGNADLAALASHQAEMEQMRVDVIAAMSQELRQPMAAILGSADILLENRQLDPRSYVQRIRRNGQQLLDRLEDISDATKVAPPEPRPGTVEVPSSRRLDCSVLLVEDDLDNQKILTDHLVRSGVSVAIAPNGEAALAEVASASERGKPFDLVLMDIQMPVMDGCTATAELRRRGYGAPILALTARATTSDRGRCLDAGCTDYLTKPITRERLVKAVATHALGSAATVPPPPIKDDEPLFSELEDGFEMQELLDGFVARLHQNAADAEAAHAAGDKDELVHIAHRLRGAAGSFGFMAISEAAGRLEEAALGGGPIAGPLATLTSLCRRARTRVLAQAA